MRLQFLEKLGGPCSLEYRECGVSVSDHSKRFALRTVGGHGNRDSARNERKLEFGADDLGSENIWEAEIHSSFVAELEQWKPSFEYNVSSVYPVGHRWFPTLELNGRRLKGKNAFYLTPGLYRHFAHRVEIGIGVPAGPQAASRAAWAWSARSTESSVEIVKIGRAR